MFFEINGEKRLVTLEENDDKRLDLLINGFFVISIMPDGRIEVIGGSATEYTGLQSRVGPDGLDGWPVIEYDV